jgi:hypothetical protein
MKLIFSLVFILMTVSTSAFAGWFTSDGDTFEECLENRRSDIHNNSQLEVAAAYCQSKHPYKVPPPQVYEPTTFNSAMAAGSNNQKLWTYVRDITISGFGKDEFLGSPEVRVMNRNNFSINGIIIGITLNSKGSSCPTSDKDYSEIFTCANGTTQAKQSGQFVCHDLIKIKPKPRSSMCVIGFSINSKLSDFNRLIK